MRGLVFALGLALASGCVRSSLEHCSNGAVCPTGLVCASVEPTAGDPREILCVTPDQLAQCEGKADLEPCDSGHCFSGVCLVDECGNGRQDPLEQCDDGNVDALDGCSADCLSIETCGNNVVDLSRGEQCDRGDSVAHDGCSNTCVLENREWRQLLVQKLPRSETGMVYDSYRNRIVLFGNGATWEWDGVSWLLASPISSPPHRFSFGMAYDSRRRRTVLFGGRNSGVLGDTWEWDGLSWNFANPPTPPPPRSFPAMAYDPIRGRTVMFGGNAVPRLSENISPLGDLWEWDGTTWTESNLVGPSARAGAMMAYDAKRGVIVMFGGVGGTNANPILFDETWELSTSGWIQRMPSTRPPGRGRGVATFDPTSGRVLLFSGGTQIGNALGDTWEWDGTDWTLRAAAELGRVHEPMMAPFPREGYVVRIDGVPQVQVGVTRVWNGSAWSVRLAESPGKPVGRSSHAGAADIEGRRILIHGGRDPSNPLGDSWLWDGGAWFEITTAGPPARRDAAMAYDHARAEFVLFGGINTAHLADTWTFDGVQWTQRTVTQPTARSNHVMVYDPVREKVVMIGGTFAGARDTRTWEWNGIDWTPLDLAGPPALEDAMAAYDPIASKVVLFGGNDGQKDRRETWTYDGAWSEVSASNAPSRVRGAMAWNAPHRALTLYGGEAGALLDDVWEWTGTAWTFVPVAGLSARADHLLLPSLDGRGVLAFGGLLPAAGGVSDAFLELVSRSSSPDETCSAADVDLDSLVRCDDPDCWPTCRPVQPHGAVGIPTAPSCGDLVCGSPRESCDTCPVDCGPCVARCGDGILDTGEDRTTCPGDFCIANDCQ